MKTVPNEIQLLKFAKIELILVTSQEGIHFQWPAQAEIVSVFQSGVTEFVISVDVFLTVLAVSPQI